MGHVIAEPPETFGNPLDPAPGTLSITYQDSPRHHPKHHLLTMQVQEGKERGGKKEKRSDRKEIEDTQNEFE